MKCAICENKDSTNCINAEMLEALIEAYKANNRWRKNNIHRWTKKFELQVKDIIERVTRMKIEEVIE